MNPKKFPICLAINDSFRDSKIELVLAEDGFDVVPFRSARELWENFEMRWPRYIIVDRLFSDGFSALDLCRNVRTRHPQPYVYIHVLGGLSSIEEIETALTGIGHQEEAIREALKPYNIEDYFANLTPGEFIAGMF